MASIHTYGCNLMIADIYLQIHIADVNALKEIFPEVQESTMRHLRIKQNMSTSELLIFSLVSKRKCKAPPVHSILTRHCQENINVDDEYLLKT